MRFNSEPVSVLYVKLVAQKRNDEVLSYTLLASDQSKVTFKTALYTRTLAVNFEIEELPLYIEQTRVKLNFASVVVA